MTNKVISWFINNFTNKITKDLEAELFEQDQDVILGFIYHYISTNGKDSTADITINIIAVGTNKSPERVEAVCCQSQKISKLLNKTTECVV